MWGREAHKQNLNHEEIKDDTWPWQTALRIKPHLNKKDKQCIQYMRMSSTKHSLCVVVDGVVANKQRRVEGFGQQRVDGDHHQQHRQLQHGVQSQEHRTRHHRQHSREYKILWKIQTHGQMSCQMNMKNITDSNLINIQSKSSSHGPLYCFLLFLNTEVPFGPFGIWDWKAVWPGGCWGGVEDVVIRLDFIFHSILEVLPTSHNVDGAIILCQHRQKSEALHVSSSIEQKEKKEDETV